MSQDSFLPYCRQVIDDDDVAAVVEALRGTYLTTGPAIAAFEADLSAVVGGAHAVVCANGTAALHLAALALELGPGDAVLVPAQTFAATANCARFVGADVVFTDVDPDTGLMRAEDLERAVAAHPTRRFKAVLPVHLNGQMADMPAIGAVARRHGLAVVEDACHALGTVADDGVPVGACAHSDMTVFSFHPAKTVAMGEGGAVTTRSDRLRHRLANLRGHGITRDPAEFQDAEQAFAPDGAVNPWYYEMQELGFNYRVTDFQCALGRSQLAKLARFADARRRLVRAYQAALAPLAPAIRPVGRQPGSNPVWHLAVALVDFDGLKRTRGEVMRALREEGIGTQVHYIPLHWQPYYRLLADGVSLPGAEAYYRRCLSLPLAADMTEADVARAVGALRRATGV